MLVSCEQVSEIQLLPQHFNSSGFSFRCLRTISHTTFLFVLNVWTQFKVAWNFQDYRNYCCMTAKVSSFRNWQPYAGITVVRIALVKSFFICDMAAGERCFRVNDTHCVDSIKGLVHMIQQHACICTVRRSFNVVVVEYLCSCWRVRRFVSDAQGPSNVNPNDFSASLNRFS